MALLEVLTYPNPRLKEKSLPVESVTNEIRQLIEDMFDTMYIEQGVGLAAPQVGVLQRVIVTDCGPRNEEDEEESTVLKPIEPLAIINPVITERTGTIVWNEGCLSVPGFNDDVERAKDIVVEGLSPEGAPLKISATGLLAVCIQHEIDHLDGILFVDRLSRLKKEMFVKKNKRRAEEVAEQ